jgi:hypothetical protein
MEHWTLAPASASGDGITLGESAGAAFGGRPHADADRVETGAGSAGVEVLVADTSSAKRVNASGPLRKITG